MGRRTYCKRMVQAVGYGRRPVGTNRCGRWRMVLPALLLACLAPGAGARAQIPILEIIKAAVKKVIVAADLEVQRLQTRTIGLQNVQKELENTMQQSELKGIANWVQQQRDLFAGYYKELMEVKNALMTYEEVKDMIEKQVQIVSGYKQAYAVIRQDKHFSADEVTQMYAVLSGIMRQSVQNLSRLAMVANSLVTQMDDAARLRIIDDTGSEINRNYNDLAQFSQQSFLLSLQRARDANDVAITRALYGIQ